MSFDYYLNQSEEDSYNIDNDEDKIIIMANKEEFIEYIDFINEKKYGDIYIEDLFLLLCKNGLENKIFWLLEYLSENDFSYLYGLRTLIQYKHHDLAKKIILSNLFPVKNKINNLLKSCAYLGELNFLKWLVDTILYDKQDIYNSLVDVCYKSNIDIAKFLLELDPNIDLKYENYNIYTHSCYDSTIEFIQWLTPICINHGMVLDDVINNAFINSFKNKLNVSEWIYNLDTNKQITKNTFDRIFTESCYNKKIETAKWIYSVCPYPDILENAENIFIHTCDIEICKWLLSIKPDINIRAKDDEAFINGYRLHNYEFSHWLLSLDNTINIGSQDNCVFLITLRSRHFDEFDWLLSQKPHADLTIDNHYIFKYLCKRGHPSSVLHLMKHLPNLYKITLHASGEYVEEYEIIYKLNKVIDPSFTILDELCCICAESNNDVITSCSHSFCYSCLNTHYKKIQNCPICRNDINCCYTNKD
jgi:hypothetical protein